MVAGLVDGAELDIAVQIKPDVVAPARDHDPLVAAGLGPDHLVLVEADPAEVVGHHLADEFRKDQGIDLRSDKMALQRLKEAAEMAKIELSTSTTTHISLPYLTAVAGEPKHLEMDLSRTDLERQVYDVVQRCRAPIEQALHDANITNKDVDRIVFVGGPTRMPVVRKYFEDLFGRKAEMGVDPMECVARGAALKAGRIIADDAPVTVAVFSDFE